MWLRKIQNFVAIRRCAQKILLAYNAYAARRFLCEQPLQGLPAYPTSRALSGLEVLNLEGVCDA